MRSYINIVSLLIIIVLLFIEPIRVVIILIFLTLAGLILLVSPFFLIIGILRFFFIDEDKKFTLQLITYSIIALLIGSGTCGILTLIN
ncbi:MULTISPECIES: hypothetical protein [Flavobacterium]|uniref:Uncharacterized protein n=1 Tax=Flavobacterium columnare TaxID=996 RepID=A0AA94EZ61_9FLAO|nr:MULTISPECIES: hypothetical protein [Flavobacterium]MCH4830882.1 hypothetical protein [Flavobacterium columnare]MCH4833178.1 hypothetical protein [Flavobacterium columnare]MCJ1807165.1 hypothetical protein [Flavobacterium covae]